MRILAMVAVALAMSSGPTFAQDIAAADASAQECQPCRGIEALALQLPYARSGAEKTERAENTVGPALICDSPQQLNRFVDLINTGREALDAIRVVNEEAENPTACGNALAAFEIGKTVAEVKMLGQLFSIVEVKVTALNDGSEWTQVQPTTQYSIRQIPVETL